MHLRLKYMRRKPHTVHKNVLKSEVERKYFFFTHKYNFVIAERKANLKIGKYLRRSNLPQKDYIALFFFNPVPLKGGGGGSTFSL